MVKKKFVKESSLEETWWNSANKLKKIDWGRGEYVGTDPEEYKAENVFFVPEKARWNYLEDNAKSTSIGVLWIQQWN